MTNEQQTVVQWLAGNDTGLSSKSLAFNFLGQAYGRIDAPYDPSDLGRCLRLIRLVPAVRASVDDLAKHNSAWAKIVPHWDELAALMESEVGIDWSKKKSAPKTFERMMAIRHPAATV